MVVCLNTGMHRKFDDCKDYYHYSCGTGVEAGKWFVEKYRSSAWPWTCRRSTTRCTPRWARTARRR